MRLDDLPQGQLEAALQLPPAGRAMTPARARLRAVAALARMVMAIDQLKAEAGEAGVVLPNAADVRGWLEATIEDICDEARLALEMGASR